MDEFTHQLARLDPAQNPRDSAGTRTHKHARSVNPESAGATLDRRRHALNQPETTAMEW
jgi:hypothetical protein